MEKTINKTCIIPELDIRVKEQAAEERSTKNIRNIPLLLSIVILSFTTNSAFAQRPLAYLFGYNLAFHATTTS